MDGVLGLARPLVGTTSRPAQPESDGHALIAVAGAVAAAHRLDDVLEVVAARRVVAAAFGLDQPLGARARPRADL